MAYDAVHDEIVVPQFYAFAILTFQGDATGDVAPIRKIFGPSTQLKNPEALAIDTVHGEIFVPQDDRVLVFARDADGDTPPIRILGGPDTGLNLGRLAVDPINNLLIASGGRALRIFDRTASGNTKPRSVISGPRSMISGNLLLTTYPPKGLIAVAARDDDRHNPEDFVGVWSIHDSGDVAPMFTIGGPNGIFHDIRGVTLDPVNKNVIASDKTLNAVVTFHVPEMF
jgi:hypothetical protein